MLKAEPFKEYSIGLLHHYGCVVLLRKAKPEWQKGKLNLPGGELKPGETSLGACIREFYEETGILHEEWRLRIKLRGKNYSLDVFSGEIDAFLPQPVITSLPDESASWCRLPQFASIADPTPVINYDDCVGNMCWIIPFCMDKYNKNWIHVET